MPSMLGTSERAMPSNSIGSVLLLAGSTPKLGTMDPDA